MKTIAPLNIGDRVRVVGTRLEWLVTDINGSEITLGRRDERTGEHIEQVYNRQMVGRVESWP